MSSKYPVADKGVLRKLSLSKKTSSKSLITDKGVLQKTELKQKRSSKSLIPGKGVLQKLSWSKKKVVSDFRRSTPQFDPPTHPVHFCQIWPWYRNIVQEVEYSQFTGIVCYKQHRHNICFA